MNDHKPWWKAEKGEAHKYVLEYVQEVEREQFETFDRFLKMDYLYDPNDPFASSGAPRRGPNAQITENVVASNVDAAHAAIAATEVRARFLTDDGDWSMQRRAKHLDWYSEGLAKLLDFDCLGPDAFRDCEIKGTGMVKIFCDDGKIKAERVLVDDIIVDEGECRAGGKPRQMHQRVIVDRDELAARFPDSEDEIMQAGTQSSEMQGHGMWADYRPVKDHEIVVVESWRLNGIHTICIDGKDILNEEWPHDWFPFAVIKWSKRTRGWYGIGLAERIAGHQRVIDKLNWQEDKLIDRHAMPVTYVPMADANLAVKTTNRIGSIVPYKVSPPTTVIPQSVPGEVKERRMYAKESAYEETGMSRLAATSRKPAGLESGVALREYRDQTTQRFSQQEKAYERFRLDMVWLALQCAKELGESAPEIIRRSKLGPKKIKWSDVNMDEARVQMSAASTLPRTSAGRAQLFLEAAQAGVITQEEARQMMDPHGQLDLEHEISLFTASLKNAEETIESILDGEVVVPEPYQNLEMLKWRCQMSYLRASDNGAPEEVLEGLRQFMVQASWELSLLQQPAAPTGEMGAPPVEGELPPPGVDPAAAPPSGPSPAAALAPQAMDLIAG